MKDGPCPICGHEMSMARCWRLTCPSNGARESFHVMQKVQRESAVLAKQVARDPFAGVEPPDQEFMF
jgi:hypothetical protein